MHNAPAVRMLNGICQTRHDARCQFIFDRAALTMKPLGQRLSGTVFVGDVVDGPGVSRFVHG